MAPALQDRYSKESQLPYMQIVTAVVQKSLAQVIERLDLADWKVGRQKNLSSQSTYGEWRLAGVGATRRASSTI